MGEVNHVVRKQVGVYLKNKFQTWVYNLAQSYSQNNEKTSKLRGVQWSS